MEIKNIRANEAGEPIGTIKAKTSNLKAIEINGVDYIDISYPNFIETLEKLTK